MGLKENRQEFPDICVFCSPLSVVISLFQIPYIDSLILLQGAWVALIWELLTSQTTLTAGSRQEFFHPVSNYKESSKFLFQATDSRLRCKIA